MITGQTVKNIYQGDGSNREFTITFEFTDASQVKFKVNGQEVTTNYSLNTVAKTLTYPTIASELDPLTSADEIEIYRDTAITQDIEFNNGGPLNAKMIEDGLDKLTMIAQEIKGAEEEEEEGELKVMPDGTDIDSLKEEGTYFIKNPTSTLGMPKAPKPSSGYTSVNGSYAIIKVVVPPIEKGTYFVYQKMILWYQYTGVNSVDEPQVYVRHLTDFMYTTQNWQRLNNGYTVVEADSTTINTVKYNGYKVWFNSPISELEITDTYSHSYSTNCQIVFTAGEDFSISTFGLSWLGETPTFVEGETYCITITNNLARVEKVIAPEED